MKMLTIFTTIAVLFTTIAFAGIDEKVTVTEEKNLESICPSSRIKTDCMTCHVMSGGKFVLKETRMDAHLDYPSGTRIINYGTPQAYGYFEVGEVNWTLTENVRDHFDYLRRHKIKRSVMEIISGGGHLLLGWRCKAFMDEWKAEGNIVETHVRALAASAAFIIFLNGSVRVANETAELMMHELKNIEGGFLFIKQSTPSSMEEEAKTLRHLQTTINDWIAKKGKMPTEKLKECLQFRELWMTGKQAKEVYGFADVVVGE